MKLTIDEVQFVIFVVLLGIVAYQQRVIMRNRKAIIWFAGHIRIDDRDLEKSPPPDDLLEIINDMEESK